MWCHGDEKLPKWHSKANRSWSILYDLSKLQKLTETRKKQQISFTDVTALSIQSEPPMGVLSRLYLVQLFWPPRSSTIIFAQVSHIDCSILTGVVFRKGCPSIMAGSHFVVLQPFCHVTAILFIVTFVSLDVHVPASVIQLNIHF